MKFNWKKLACVLILLLIVTVSMAHGAHAQNAGAPGSTGTPPTTGNLAQVFGLNMWDFVAEGLANVFNSFLTIASWLLATAGMLLNYSMNLTLHIHDFVSQTPAIYATWTALRDIISLFIIFFLIYAAFKLILGMDDKFGSLIKNIVVAGILINFSFFFAGLGIDASNIISMQLYDAIAPSNTLSTNLAPASITGSSNGGLANIFMTSLRIPSLYNASGQQTASLTAVNNGGPGSIFTPIKIILISVTSIIIMITAAVSFTLAAVAFVVRFVMLIFLLAFSPIWMASFIAPEVKKKSEKWVEHYKSMLLFMPVYLLLMYLALSVLTSVGPLGCGSACGNVATTATPGVPTTIIPPGGTAPATNGTAPAGTTATMDDSLVSNAYAAGLPATSISGTWYASFIPLSVNAVIVIFLLNMPLITAISIGGSTLDFIDTKKYGAHAIWSQFGSRTAGRAAYKVGQSRLLKGFASRSSLAGGLLYSATDSVSKSGFGTKGASYEDIIKNKKKAQEGLHKRLGGVERADYADDDAGKAAFDAAKDRAKAYQSSFITNLPWARNSIIGAMVDNRANRETAGKLKKAADDAAVKGQKSNAQKELRALNRELEEINAVPDTERSADEREAKIRRIREIATKKEEQQAIIDKANDLENSDRDSTLKGLSSGGGGGGDKGGDKK